MKSVLVLALAAALAERGVAGMQAQQPPTVAPPTGAITGVVVDSVTSRPIAGAIVQISGTPSTPTGAPVAPVPQTFSTTSSADGRVTVTEPPPEPFRPQRQLTDEQGRFVFVGLPGNMSYSLTAGRFGYFDAAYGRRSTTGNIQTARRITLLDGQWFRDARIEMVRPSAISGRVFDESGDPIVGAAVRSYTEIYVGGVRQAAAGPAALTDDRGVYRIGNLTPGRYLIAVPSVQHAVPAAMTAAELAGLSPQAAATAQTPVRRDPSFPAAGDFRTVVSAHSPPPIPQAAGRPQMYATTLHPSARSMAEATAVQLQPGDDRAAVDVRLTPVPAFRISGRLEGPPEAVTGMSLRLLMAGLETLGRGSESATALVSADGSFAFLNVPNGRYTIIANRSITEYSYRPPGSNLVAVDAGNAPGVRFISVSQGAVLSGPTGAGLSRHTYQGNLRYQARQTVTVSGRDIADLVVPMQPGVTMRGELVYESTKPDAAQTQVFGLLRAEAANGDPTLGQPSFNFRSASGTPGSNEFVLEGLLPGAYLLRAPGTAKSIVWNGRDYADVPFDTTTGRDITGVVITLTDQTTTMSGTIRDRTGQPAANTAAIVFPVDRTRWMNFGTQPARIRATPGSTGGAYTLRGLPAGDYLIVAVDDDLLDRWKDPTFLEAASRVATRFSIAWGESKTLELTVQEIPVKLLALTVAVCAVVSFHAGAQAQSGSIGGIILSTDAQPQPITRAIVTLTGGNIPDNVSVVTDSSGRFLFQNLAPGRYSVSVTKPAYLPMSYGATRTGRPGTSIALNAAQNLDIRIVLPRGAVITGTVRDQSGAPAPGVQVTVSQATLVTSAGGFRTSGDTLITDDRGVYRSFGLKPDEYVVSAVPRIVGNGEISSLARAEVDTRVRELEQRHGAAAAAPRGTAAPQTQSVETRPAGEPERLGFAPTYYPGTTIAASATRVRVAAGDERDGVDIALVPVRSARVSGRIQSGDIPPQRLRPALNLLGPPQPAIFSPTLAGPAADGSFSFSNVTPGRYTLIVRSGPGALMAYGDGRSGATTDNPAVAAQFAAIDLDVDGRDITGLGLSLRPALSMSGRVVFQGTAAPPKSLTGIRITMSTNSAVAGPAILNGVGGGFTVGAAATADGTFRIAGIVPDRYSVSIGAPTGWWLQSVMVNGRDVLDDGLQLDGGSSDITDAVVTFVDARSELAGTLTAASGQAASEFTVLVFPADRSYWRAGARRIKTARPASDGTFSIMDLPAGDYLLAALTDVDPADLALSSFFDQIVGASVKITVADGKKTTQDLRIAR